MKISVYEKAVAERIHGSNLIEKRKEGKSLGLSYRIKIAQRKPNSGRQESIRLKFIIYYLLSIQTNFSVYSER